MIMLKLRLVFILIILVAFMSMVNQVSLVIGRNLGLETRPVWQENWSRLPASIFDSEEQLSLEGILQLLSKLF